MKLPINYSSTCGPMSEFNSSTRAQMSELRTGVAYPAAQSLGFVGDKQKTPRLLYAIAALQVFSVIADVILLLAWTR